MGWGKSSSSSFISEARMINRYLLTRIFISIYSPHYECKCTQKVWTKKKEMACINKDLHGEEEHLKREKQKKNRRKG
jgi:hypothetical protein